MPPRGFAFVRLVRTLRENWAAYGELVLALAAGVLMFLSLALSTVSRPLAMGAYILTYAVGGYYKAREAWTILREERKLTVDALMFGAAIAAMAIGYPFEGAMLIFIFALSGALETISMARSRRDLSSLLSAAPTEATLLREGREERIPVEEIRPGMRLLVRPGEVVPVDGVIVEGETTINEATITGESVPADKETGAEVYAGTLNIGGAVVLEATRRPEETVFAKIVRLVESAQAEMPPAQRLIERVEGYYVYAVFGLTLLLIALLPTVFHVPFSEAVYKAIVFMVVASPCAVVASISPAVFSALSNASRHGVLVKGGGYLETLSKVRVVAFDKTGTLTFGRPRVTDVLPAPEISEESLLEILATAESRSEHPIARAILAYADTKGVAYGAPEKLTAVAGQGILAEIAGQKYRIGNARHVSFHELPAEERSLWEARVEALAEEGKSVVYIARDGKILGIVGLQDVLRPEARRTVQALKRMGIRVAMLTGDREAVARRIAEELGIDEVRAELLPQDKLDHVRALREAYGPITMVGDGINDAPALAYADIGIAMGDAGTDVALETSDVVLMNDELERIPYAIALGRSTMRIVKQNLLFAVSVIALLIGVNFGFSLPLPLGVVGHEGSTILVILNSLRLLGIRPATRASNAEPV
ncbi:MAG: heavy metal translocating P-type ATPase [Brockia lithotrophica]|nr:heavy metal translocating P-type ATPase [Brockia lithotrophica]